MGRSDDVNRVDLLDCTSLPDDDIGSGSEEYDSEDYDPEQEDPCIAAIREYFTEQSPTTCTTVRRGSIKMNLCLSLRSVMKVYPYGDRSETHITGLSNDLIYYMQQGRDLNQLYCYKMIFTRFLKPLANWVTLLVANFHSSHHILVQKTST